MKCVCGKCQPLLTPQELAKIYYETDLLANGSFSVLFDREKLVVIRKEWDNGTFDICSKDCIFLDGENCKLPEDLVPEVCRNFKPTSGDCVKDFKSKLISGHSLKNVLEYNKTLRKIRSFTREDLKLLKPLSILYYIVHTAQRIDYSLIEEIDSEYEYKLVILEERKGKKISSVRLFKLKTNHPQIKPFTDTYNKMNSNIVLRDVEFVKLVMNRVNKVITGISGTTIDDELLSKSEVDPVIRDNYVMLAFWMLLLNKFLLNKGTPKYVLNYMKDLHGKSILNSYLTIYYLIRAMTLNKPKLKNEDEITFKDLLVPDYLRDIFESLDTVANRVYKAFISQK